MAHDVFFSYSSHDRAVAQAACEALEAGGVRCWIAFRDAEAGLSYEEAIVGAIETCRAIVLVFSAAANSSAHVFREMNIAAEEGRPVVPLRIEDVEMSDGMRYYLGSVQWLDALTPPLAPHLERLRHAVAARIGAPPPLRRSAPASRPAVYAPPPHPSPAHAFAPAQVLAPAYVPAYAPVPRTPLWKNPWVTAGAVVLAVLLTVVTVSLGLSAMEDGPPYGERVDVPVSTPRAQDLAPPAPGATPSSVELGELAWRQGRLADAYRILQPEAQRGDSAAQHWIGHVCLSAGDRQQAVYWFNLAVRNGVEAAGRDLRDMGM